MTNWGILQAYSCRQNGAYYRPTGSTTSLLGLLIQAYKLTEPTLTGLLSLSLQAYCANSFRPTGTTHTDLLDLLQAYWAYWAYWAYS